MSGAEEADELDALLDAYEQEAKEQVQWGWLRQTQSVGMGQPGRRCTGMQQAVEVHGEADAGVPLVAWWPGVLGSSMERQRGAPVVLVPALVVPLMLCHCLAAPQRFARCRLEC